MDGMFDIKSLQAFKILEDLESDNSIDKQTCAKHIESLSFLHKNLIKYMEIEKIITDHLNKFKEDNKKVLGDKDVLEKQQQELNDMISRTIEECHNAKKELNEYENVRAMTMQYEIDMKYSQIEKLEREIRSSEEETIQRLLVQIDHIKDEINGKQKELNKIEEEIKKTEAEYAKCQESKNKIDLNNEKKKKENLEVKELIAIKHNEIQNESKSKEQNLLAEKKLLQEIEAATNTIFKKDEIIKALSETITNQQQSITKIKEEMITLKRENSQLEKEHMNFTNEKSKLENEIKSKNETKYYTEKKKLKTAKDYELAKDLQTKLELTYKKKEMEVQKKLEEVAKLRLSLSEDLNKLDKEREDLNKLLANINSLRARIDELDEKIEDKMDKEKKKEELKKNCLERKKEIEKEIVELEDVQKNIVKRADKVRENIEEIKNKRDTIARTKERLDEQTKLINEEIQIKELIFLDMTKKNEELRNMYQKYHVLYESVLTERNKNVVKIQNANQNRAQLKEKMRILSTEMDILDAELSEIFSKLLEKEKELNKINARQNSLKQDINGYESKKLVHKEEITKLTNENEKLHSIINAIETEMINLRIDYELSCENRNYTGIQLIERNDELCVFYEKIHHLETRKNELYKKILEKEALLQRSIVEVTEIERFIEINRKKIPLIPEISNKIKELDNELKILNKTLEKLIEEVENPDSTKKKELPGEDPDTDYLKMKYDQLSDMLNEKKEQLLEKELINDEINEIAENLRKKALDDREKNLEINEKINEYEMKLNELTKKNIASTSELAMFDAILSKLKKTKEEKENLLEEALARYQNNMPPTEDCMNLWESKRRLDLHRSQYIENRKREVKEKEEIIIGEIPHRRKPEKRNVLYTDPKTGLPSLAYGKYAPFNVYPTPPNMRHLKNICIKREGGQEQLLEINNK